MPTPSLLIVPARFKSGKLYSQIPTSGEGDFTVTRATSATRVNASGLIDLVASGIPRLDYFASGGTVGCPALLIEPSAQNLVLRSQEIDVTPTWSRNLGGTGLLPSITANAVVSPDGTQNAETIVFDRGAGNTINDRSFLEQSITIPTTGAYILSVYAKASTAGDVGKQIFIRIGGAGTLTPITLTANWVRYSRAETSVASGSQVVQIGNRGTFTADNSVSVDLWGAQAEGGAIPTSYILTTTAAVTRGADVISRTSASALIGQSEGTIYAEVDLKNKGVSISRVIYLSDGTSNNEIRISHSVTTAGDLQIAIRLAGTLVVNQTSPTAVYFGINKIAVGYKVGTNEVAMYVNGSQINLTTSSGNMPACNTIHLGSQLGTSNFLNDRIRAAALYTTRLTNDQLAALTTP